MRSKYFHMKMMNRITLFLFLMMMSCNMSSCLIQESVITYLGFAKNLLSKVAKPENISGIEEEYALNKRILDCADLYKRGYNESGVYVIWPINISFLRFSMRRLYVYCDMTTDGGGWTVIQRRGEFKREDDFFGKDWQGYKKGFGNIRKDFWLGNDNIFVLTNQKAYSVRFDLVFEPNKTVYAEYDIFWIEDESNNYTLHISDYSGNAGNAMKGLDRMKFSTKDRDNDLWGDHCARKYNSGWWYCFCAEGHLNGRYNNGTEGMWWLLNGEWESVLQSEIKIRPTVF